MYLTCDKVNLQNLESQLFTLHTKERFKSKKTPCTNIIQLCTTLKNLFGTHVSQIVYVVHSLLASPRPQENFGFLQHENMIFRLKSDF